jgi:quinoprotein dehydrogenase-associated probable ABC transporter substrate-binding protein
VCADPDNLPYSREDGAGFENRIVQLVANEMGATVRYAWQPLRRGAVRKTLDGKACDMLAGVPVGLERVTTTRPYYRSGFVFVYAGDAAPFESFDDARLRTVRVGVQLVGADMAATPAALALARRGIVDNVVGFSVYGAQPAAQRMIGALERGELDVAVVWGPQAGYFARRARTRLAMSLAHDPARLEFAIAMAVRKGDIALRDELDAALARSLDRVRAVLAEFGVPSVKISR